MSIFYPAYYFKRVWELTPEWLDERELRVLLLDVDNTLTTHDNPDAGADVTAWIQRMHDADIRLLIISNNKPARVLPFAEKLGLGCIANAAKPLGFGVKRALARLGVQKREIALVGDQVFTDVMCANLAGVTSVLVEPMELEKFLFFKLKRRLERTVLRGFDGIPRA